MRYIEFMDAQALKQKYLEAAKATPNPVFQVRAEKVRGSKKS